MSGRVRRGLLAAVASLALAGALPAAAQAARCGGTGFSGATDVAAAAQGAVVVAGWGRLGDRYGFILIRLTAAGAFDPSFGGGDGVVSTPISDNDVQPGGVSLATDAQGRLLVAGTALSGPRMAVARYTPGGALDPSFGDKGLVVSDLGGAGAIVYGVAVDAGGRIYVGGNTSADGFPTRLALARLTSSGGFDAGFGANGVVTTPNPAVGVDAYAADMVLAGDRPVIVGHAGQAVMVAKYLPSGAPDPAFGGGAGVVVEDLGPASASAATIQGGSIVIAGSTPSGTLLLRFTEAGALDPGFGSGGVVATSLGAPHDRDRMSSVAPFGANLIAGGAVGGLGHPSPQFTLASFDAAGELDGSFGSGGLATTMFDPHPLSGASGVGAVLPLGAAIVAVGGAQSFTVPPSFVVARYSASGHLDASFGSGGTVVAALGSMPTCPPNTKLTGAKVFPKQRRAVFRFKGVGGVPPRRFECKLDRAAFRPCRSPRRLVRLSLGPHRFRVRAVDAAGKVDPSPVVRPFRIRAVGARKRKGPGGAYRGPRRACSDFDSQAKAQEFFRRQGGTPNRNASGLDGDGDGVACDSLGEPWRPYVAAGYNRGGRFFYGAVATPGAPSVEGGGRQCRRGLIHLYKVRPGRDRFIALAKMRPTGLMTSEWKIDRERIRTSERPGAIEAVDRGGTFYAKTLPGVCLATLSERMELGAGR